MCLTKQSSQWLMSMSKRFSLSAIQLRMSSTRINSRNNTWFQANHREEIVRTFSSQMVLYQDLLLSHQDQRKFEMTLRDYLCHYRYLNHLNDILLDMIKGVKELHELGYVHRDLKSQNVMLNLCPLEEVVIDFNRALRQENIPFSKVLGTPGYFPLQEKWTNGSVQWDVWAVGAILLESYMESMSQFGTKHEKQSISLAQKHIKQEDVCQEIKSIVDMIIVRAPNYPRQSQDDILQTLERARFKRYDQDKQIKFV